MADPIIKLEDVNFWYNLGKPYEVQAMKNVNIEIERGEYVAFFGPSGSTPSGVRCFLLYLGAYAESCSSPGAIWDAGDLAHAPPAIRGLCDFL